MCFFCGVFLLHNHKVVTGPILEKYSLINKAKKDLSLSRKQLRCAKLTGRSCSLLQWKKKNGLGKTSSLVEEFFLEDANSSPTAGKRETITHHKDKQQKRYLCDTMLNLYEKFKSEIPSARISYTSFTRLRPFYVVPASVH